MSLKKFFKNFLFYSSLTFFSSSIFSYANNNVSFVGFSKGKDIVVNTIMEYLEPVYNPCIPERNVPPENYSSLVKQILFYTADKMGNNDGITTENEISVALQYTLMSWKDLNKKYCPDGGPPFEETYNFKVVKELYEEYKYYGPNVLPWTIKFYLKLKHGI